MALRQATRISRRFANRIEVAPSVEPVAVVDLHTHLRLVGTSEDSALADLIAGSREWLEQQYGVAFIDQRWKVAFDRWPGGREDWWDGIRDGHIGHITRSGRNAAIELPRWPLTGITSVTVYDQNSDATTVDVAATFDIDIQGKRGRLSLRSGVAWPSATRPVNAGQIVHDAGFGADA